MHAGPEALRGVGGILFNHRGKRFVNELGRRDEVSSAMYRHCTAPGEALSQAESGLPEAAAPVPSPVHAFIVLDAPAVATFGPNFNFYWKVKHFFTEVKGAAGVAKEIGGTASAETVASELAAYTAAARAGRYVIMHPLLASQTLLRLQLSWVAMRAHHACNWCRRQLMFLCRDILDI